MEPEMLQNLRFMLLSNELDTVKLAVEIINGMPELLLEICPTLYVLNNLSSGNTAYFYKHPNQEELFLFIQNTLRDWRIQHAHKKIFIKLPISLGTRKRVVMRRNLEELARLTDLATTLEAAWALYFKWGDYICADYLLDNLDKADALQLLKRHYIKNDKEAIFNNLEWEGNYLPNILLEYKNQLDYLSLCGNKYVNIPKLASEFTNLKTLDISNTNITLTPKAVQYFPNLEKLIISYYCSQIENIATLPKLKTLIVKDHTLVSDTKPWVSVLFKGLKKCTQLQHVQLADSIKISASDIDQEFVYFTSIRANNKQPLDFNNLLEIAKLAYQQTKETSLLGYLFQYADIDYIEKQLWNMIYNAQTQTLDLDKLLLIQIPEYFTKYPVKHLLLGNYETIIYSNTISINEKLAFLSKLYPNIESLILGAIHFTEEPSSIFLFEHLKVLDLGIHTNSDCLTDLKQLINLEELYIGVDDFELTIGIVLKTLAKIKKLKKLYLRGHFAKQTYQKIQISKQCGDFIHKVHMFVI